MEAVLDRLQHDADDIKALLRELDTHSSIYDVPSRHFEAPPDKYDVLLGTRSRRGGFSMGYSAWNKLGSEGQRAQAAVKEAYTRLFTILQAILRDAPNTMHAAFEKADQIVRTPIEQDRIYPSRNAFEEACQALDDEVGLLRSLAQPGQGIPLLVPDTNALIFNPAIEQWTFSEFQQFVIVLVPTVTRELDSLKINHRNEDVRKKAEKLIRQINEYQRRGDIVNGVNLVTGRSDIRACPVEPDVKEALPWLDPDNDDDRLLASTIGIMRGNLSSPVLIVTRDLNMRIKAGHARIPTLDPPEPTQPSS